MSDLEHKKRPISDANPDDSIAVMLIFILIAKRVIISATKYDYAEGWFGCQDSVDGTKSAQKEKFSGI